MTANAERFRVKMDVENVEHPMLPRRYAVTVHGPAGVEDYEVVDFILLYRASDGCCTWIMLDESGIPCRHGTYYAPLRETLKLMRRCASSQYRFLCDREDAETRAGDEEAYRQATHDTYRGLW